MTKKSRLILFAIMATIFLALTPIILLYVQGYRFNFGNFSLIQAGSLYIRTEPKKALVFLNKKPIKGRTPILVNGLLPKKTNIRIEKDGFYSWEKQIEIKSGLVSEAKNVILIPTEIKSRKILSSVEEIYPSPQNNYFLTINQHQITLTNEKTSRAINLDSYFENPIEIEQMIDAIKKNHIIWHQNEENVIIQNEQTNYIVNFPQGVIKKFMIKNTKLDGGKIIEGFITAEKIRWQPAINNTILFIYNDNLYSYNIDSENSKIIINQVANYNLVTTAINTYLYYIDYSGFINKYNFLTKSNEQVSKTPIIYHEPIEIKISYDQNKIAILEKDENQLFIVNKNKIKTINNVNFAAFSDDSRKIMYGNAKKVSIFYLENTIDQPKKIKGSVEEPINSDNNNIKKSLWYEKTNQHLWILTDDLYFSELDDRQPRNTYTVINNNLSDVFISGNKIYYVKNNDLYFTEIGK